MIDIAKLRKEDIGKWVEYKGRERGCIKSYNNIYIFVVYKCAGEWNNFDKYTGVATKPQDLSYIDHLISE